MLKPFKYSLFVAVLSLAAFACTPESISVNDVPQDVIDQISAMGFNPDGIERVEDGYRIERDIIITLENLKEGFNEVRVPDAEQYSTNNLVNSGGGRTITIFMPGGRRGFGSAEQAALDEAISRFNAENLELTFQRTNSSSADIVFQRLRRRDERRGVLGSAGFPTSSGDPFGTISLSGILQSSFGLSVNGIATIIAHEMGHCIGFRHTDYFDRSISCGGSPTNEGDAGVGANLIPGTPAGASLADASWMLSCTDGSDRPFNSDDQVALDFLY